MSLLLGYFGSEPNNPRQLELTLQRLGEQGALVSKAMPEFGFGVVGGPTQILPPGNNGLGVLCGRVLKDWPLLAAVEREGLSALQSDCADGSYALAHYDPQARRLLLGHDPFGAVRLFYTRLGRSLWFSTALRALLVIPGQQRSRELDSEALHTYLAFSFVAAPHTLIKGVQVVPPNVALTFASPEAAPVAHQLVRPIAAGESFAARAEEVWLNSLRSQLDGLLERQFADAPPEVALHLSGGLDSSAVGAWLKEAGKKVHAFHLDFGPPYNAERPYAEEVAKYLDVPLALVPVLPDKRDGGKLLRRLVWQMGEPWGDPVTLPLYLGYQATRQVGLATVFNGEGGDQLFAGWPNRPMLAAELYGEAGQALPSSRTRHYLQTFHHFYGLEEALYAPALKKAAEEFDLTGYVEPYLEESALPHLLDRLRWTNFWLKGSQNIMPRVAAFTHKAEVEMYAPLFDRQLAQFALSIPADLLMRGTQEKYLLKQALAVEGLLPDTILDRPKRGMGVPATEWCLGSLRDEFKRLLGRLERRGLFRKDYLQMLSKGQDLPTEIRRHRRMGEKIWQLGILEVWLELFYDTVTVQEP